MEASQRACQILSLAQSSTPTNWFAALPQNERDVLLEIRERWHAERHVTGVSASSLARAIIAQMPECKFPRYKGLAEWLIRNDEPQKS